MPELIITGDRLFGGVYQPEAEVWRVSFAGWDEPHELRAAAWCVPKRYSVVEDGRILAADSTVDHPIGPPGEVFRIRVPAPPAP